MCIRDRAWKELQALSEGFNPDLAEWFAKNPERATQLSFTAAQLHVDLSKNLLTEPVLAALMRLASQTKVEAHRDAMFAGEHINNTEDRAVLHTALRGRAEDNLQVDGQNVSKEVAQMCIRDSPRCFLHRGILLLARFGEYTCYRGCPHLSSPRIRRVLLGFLQIGAAQLVVSVRGFRCRR